jgi:C-terminal processing protease CtpA/Prc
VAISHSTTQRAASVVVALTLAGSIGCAAQEAPLGSIGAVLGRSPDSGAVHVRDVPGDELLESQLMPGDRLVSIDGVEVDSLEQAELRSKLRGPVGSKLRVTLLRGDSVVRVEIARVPLREGRPPPGREQRLEE